MKAKDYYQKYHDGILSPVDEVSNQAVADLMTELVRETAAIMEARKVTTASGLGGATREMEQKFQAILGLFEKHDGIRPIVDNGYRAALNIISPSVRTIMAMDDERRRRRLGMFGRKVQPKDG